MSSAAWCLSDSQLRAWLDILISDGCTVAAPVEEDGVLLFRPIASADRAILSPSGKTRWSPKEFLFPRSEKLYTFAVDGGSVRLSDPPKQETRQVLIGVRPCDAAGLAVLDRTFLGATPDSIYGLRREHIVIISAGCADADPECFCTAVGGSPAGTEGSDLQIIPLDDVWLLRSFTEKGGALVEPAAKEWTSASAKDLKKVEELGQRVADQIEQSPIKMEWGKLLEEGFEHPVWESVTEHCLSCSTCAYVCPSCTCFDMNHEGSAWCGSQCRSWDACTYAMFTLHASGHNPRSNKSDRFRQRVLHKFAFTDNDQEYFRCVGCGRCVTLCPAGVDIVEVVRAVVTAMQEESPDESR
jgi:formate hydrogenlyase subunit 6/NADH:ubiquinone oxidoreductase subunit I